MGDKCEIMRTTASRVGWETSGRADRWRRVGEKCKITQAKNLGCSRRQVGDKYNWETGGRQMRNHAN